MLAECPNQEGCHMSFEVFEKTPLPGDKDKALTLIYKDKPKNRIEVWVKEGFAVAEVKLQHCKEDTENEDWEEKLDPDDGELKTTGLYLKVKTIKNLAPMGKPVEFLKEELFVMKETIKSSVGETTLSTTLILHLSLIHI